MIKKAAFVSILLFSFLLDSCNTIGGNGGENKEKAFREGMVNQMSAGMFRKLIWDYKKDPKEFVYKGDLPCMIDFYADWCRPCRMVSPIMDDFANEYKGKIKIFRVNTDEEQELSRLFHISSIPVVLFVPKEGKPQMSVGALPKESYRQAIGDLLKVK